MANRWPIASGNWSDQNIWSGSIIPTATDDVYLNNQTVTLDQNITILTLRNAASASAITANGRIEIYSDYNITANSIRCSNTTDAIIQYYNTGSITITSPLTHTTTGGNNSNMGVYNGNSGTINIIGDISPSNGGVIINNPFNGIFNIIGNITPSQLGSDTRLIINTANGTINITGDVYTIGSTGVRTYLLVNSSTGIVNITGNVIGSTSGDSLGSNSSPTILNSSIGTINITGNVSALQSPGIATVANIGTITGPASIFNIIGSITATTASNAVRNIGTNATNVFSGPLICSGSKNAIYCYNIELYDDVTTRYEIGVSGSNDTITLFSPDQVTGVPSGSDVRVGTIYGPGNELTGSMYVPHPNSVSIGIATDNTTGSAIVKPEDLWNYALTSMTASNSIGQRLANTATSASNAAIVNAFG